MLLQKYKDMAMETPRGKVALEVVRKRWDEWDAVLVAPCGIGEGAVEADARIWEAGSNAGAMVFFEALWRFGVLEDTERRDESYAIRRLDSWLEKIFFEEALKFYGERKAVGMLLPEQAEQGGVDVKSI